MSEKFNFDNVLFYKTSSVHLLANILTISKVNSLFRLVNNDVLTQVGGNEIKKNRWSVKDAGVTLIY